MNRRVAKVFMNGRSQAIRLPKEFRLSGGEVYIEKNKNQLIITEKDNRETFKENLNAVFGCCPDFNPEQDRIPDKPRKVTL